MAKGRSQVRAKIRSPWRVRCRMASGQARGGRRDVVSGHPDAAGRASWTRYLDGRRIVDAGAPLRAIVAPHAGLMYSGPVAAYAYNAARRASTIRRLVLVGPSHFVPFKGVSIWPRRRVGDAARAGECGPESRRAIAAAPRRSSTARRARARAFAGDADAVHRPPAAGRADRADGDGAPDTRRPRLRWARPSRRPSRRMHPTRCSWRAATSRTTRMPARQRRWIGVVIEHVERLDADGLMRRSSASRVTPAAADRWSPCSTRRAGSARRMRGVLQYADSGDVSGDKSSVVGYMAAAIW